MTSRYIYHVEYVRYDDVEGEKEGALKGQWHFYLQGHYHIWQKLT